MDDLKVLLLESMKRKKNIIAKIKLCNSLKI